jgi:Carbohydrate binding module (family 6)
MSARCLIPMLALMAIAPRLRAADDVAMTIPFSGKPHAIPGTIEAEHWDKGDPGVAYRDVEEKNLGEDYREPTQVDIEKRSDASNGHGIGWTRKGEWLIYSVEVTQDGTYRLEVPVASNGRGGIFHLELDGRDVTGPIRVPDTGGWQTLKLLKHPGVKLRKGRYRMKLSLDEQGPSGSIGDIDYLKFVREDVIE